MALILIGGERLEWGEDDMADFLSQYGVVYHRYTEGMWVLYLSLDDRAMIVRHEDKSVRPYLYAYERDGRWVVNVRLKDGRYVMPEDALVSVKRYLSHKKGGVL